MNAAQENAVVVEISRLKYALRYWENELERAQSLLSNCEKKIAAMRKEISELEFAPMKADEHTQDLGSF